jgi:DNA-binding GntR family transcriptional regulator
VRLQRVSTVEALVAALRDRILDGELAGGARLREAELTEAYGVARHSVRAALRELEHERLVRLEPNRGASVAELDAGELRALGELRVALEVEGARLALARHGGRLPRAVHDAAARLREASAAAGGFAPVAPATGAGLVRDDSSRTGFAPVAAAHEELHHAIVAAAESPRLTAAHAALAGELRLFLSRLRPAWDLDALAAEHDALVAAIEGDAGPEALRAHIEASTAALVAHLGEQVGAA